MRLSRHSCCKEAGCMRVTISGFGRSPCRRLHARWNWNNWEGVGGGVNSVVEAVTVNAGGVIFMGGSFTDAGGQGTADFVTRWKAGVG